jgi:hypothetical protein
LVRISALRLLTLRQSGGCLDREQFHLTVIFISQPPCKIRHIHVYTVRALCIHREGCV